MTAHITTTKEEHVICSEHEDTKEVQRTCKSIEDKRLIAALFHGVEDFVVRKIRLTICDDCVARIENTSHAE